MKTQCTESDYVVDPLLSLARSTPRLPGHYSRFEPVRVLVGLLRPRLDAGGDDR